MCREVAWSAVIKLLSRMGTADIIAVDERGIIHTAMDGLNDSERWIAEHTNESQATGTLHDALVDADVFIGVSGPNLFGAEQVATMADDAVVFALANPDPEVDPLEAQRHASVVATGRSDYPNQINNVLAFPGVFRGLLDAHARDIDDRMLLAAADAIADVVDGERLNASFIVPSVFDSAVSPAVADAVKAAAEAQEETA